MSDTSKATRRLAADGSHAVADAGTPLLAEGLPLNEI